MSETKEIGHTQVPWKWAEARTMRHLIDNDGHGIGITIPKSGNKNYFREGDAKRESNAAFIVRAVNNHEKLVKALKEVDQMLSEPGKFNERTIRDGIRALLRELGE